MIDLIQRLYGQTEIQTNSWKNYLRRIINFVSGKEGQNSRSIDVVKKSNSTLKGDDDNNFVELA